MRFCLLGVFFHSSFCAATRVKSFSASLIYPFEKLFKWCLKLVNKNYCYCLDIIQCFCWDEPHFLEGLERVEKKIKRITLLLRENFAELEFVCTRTTRPKLSGRLFFFGSIHLLLEEKLVLPSRSSLNGSLMLEKNTEPSINRRRTQ